MEAELAKTEPDLLLESLISELGNKSGDFISH